jgi:hypothetical protein
MRIEISPPSDAQSVTVWAHEACFSRVREPAVQPDSPGDRGRIPSQARCVFCGRALPTIGRHPYCFDVGDFNPPHRFWSHPECISDRVVAAVVEPL